STIDVFFASDSALGLLPLPPPNLTTTHFAFKEDGTFQQMLDVSLENGQRFIFFVRSDVDSAAVPEPATILLLASGVAGLGGVAWRRRPRPARPRGRRTARQRYVAA